LDQPRERERERDLSSQKENRFAITSGGVTIKTEKKGERKGSLDKYAAANAAYNLNHMGVGGNVIAIASAQAIAATQQVNYIFPFRNPGL
jgi:hypothetical protein